MRDIESLNWAKAQGVRMLTDDDCAELGRQGVIDRIRAVAGEQPTYISFDIDAWILPTCRAPSHPSRGNSVCDVQVILRGLRGIDAIGADVVEPLPLLDPSGRTASRPLT
ncbi:arginase family protein [Mesorhizobium sp. M0244]